MDFLVRSLLWISIIYSSLMGRHMSYVALMSSKKKDSILASIRRLNNELAELEELEMKAEARAAFGTPPKKKVRVRDLPKFKPPRMVDMCGDCLVKVPLLKDNEWSDSDTE
jgi:hypothetical protein